MSLRRFYMLIVLVALSVVWVFPTYAQSPLPQEQLTLLQRALDATKRLDTYQSYIAEGYSQQHQEISMLNPDGTVLNSQNSTETKTDLSAIIRGADPNGFFAQVISNDSSSNGTGTQYTVQGELRLVDGTLYGMGQTVTGSAPFIFAPGFGEIANPADANALDEFNPQGFTETVNGLPQDNPLDDLAAIGPLVASVTVEPSNLNGAPVEIITATILAENLGQFMALQGDPAANDPTTSALLQNLTPDSQAQLTVYVDQGGNALQTEINLRLVVQNADATLIVPDGGLPAGTVINAVIEMAQRRVYTQINVLEEKVGPPTIG